MSVSATSQPAARGIAPAAAGRLWEVDVARTAAIAMMVAYHVAYDIHQLAPDVDIDAFSGGWRALQLATGSSFLFVVGVSLAISGGRSRARGLGEAEVYRRHARRAVQVIGAALLVSLGTWVALGSDDYVRFGILHCIAIAMLVGGLTARLGWLNLPLAAAALAGGLALDAMEPTGNAALIVLGVPPSGDFGVDLYPLLPWLAPMLLGLAVGSLLYPQGRRGGWGRRLPTPRGALLAGAPGRHALPVYLGHQLVLIPLVAGLLVLVGVEVSFSGL